MTVLFNVTDAIGDAPHHGITRTERRLAAALLGRDDIEFVVVRGGRLLRVEPDQVGALIENNGRTSTPTVERFGVDPPPRPPSRASVVLDRRRFSQRGPGNRSVLLDPVVAGSDDVLVSVGLDWVHHTLDVAERHVFGSGGRFLSMCYDLIPIDHPEWLFPPDADGFRAHLRRAVRCSSAVLCISTSTQRDLLRHFPELGVDRAPLITLGADAASRSDPEHAAFAATLFDGEPYAIYCATIDRRKNHQVLYRAMRELSRRGSPGNLVFVGRTGSGTGDLIDSMRHDSTISGRIAHVTDCDDAHLAALYERSVGAVYPSLYEGWGLGVTEALAHGKPCVVASGSSLGEAGLGVCPELHPLRTAEWTDALERLFGTVIAVPDFELPTWEAAADQMLGVAAT